MPLVVTHTCRRMYSDISASSPVTARGIMSSIRWSMNGIISPQCPMITRSPGCRAKVPEPASRSVCSPASACQPQALVASPVATGAGSPS
jgi:hypothetical protein